MTESKPCASFTHLVLYDGVCGFCDRLVRWLIAHDPEGRFRYAPLQGETASALRARHPEIPEDLDTVVYVHADAATGGERVFMRSQAMFRIFEVLGGRWRWVAWLGVLPRAVTDLGYLLFARIRYAVFGRLDACRLPTGPERTRFLV